MSQNQLPNSNESQDHLGTGLAILSFCFPIVGAIIYFVNKENKPQKAKSACHAALWGFGIGIVLQILVTIAGAGAS